MKLDGPIQRKPHNFASNEFYSILEVNLISAVTKIIQNWSSPADEQIVLLILSPWIFLPWLLLYVVKQ